MANKNIFALSAISVPLAGTEVIPIWNGTTTTKVTVANLTSGRVLDFSGATVAATSAPRITFRNSTSTSQSGVDFYTGSSTYEASIRHQANTGMLEIAAGRGAAWGGHISLVTDGVEKVRIAPLGDVTVRLGNVVQGTTGKGFNFTANTPAAGMTSQLLNWYEEGTWTPTLSSDGTPPTVSSYTERTGTFTRIGNLVYLRCVLRAVISVIGTGTPQITGMPYTSKGLEPPVFGLVTLLTGTISSSYMVAGPKLTINGPAYNTVAGAYLVFTVSYQI